MLRQTSRIATAALANLETSAVSTKAVAATVAAIAQLSLCSLRVFVAHFSYSVISFAINFNCYFFSLTKSINSRENNYMILRYLSIFNGLTEIT